MYRVGAKQGLLKPWELAKYIIVITTFSRCEQEYGKEVELGNLGGSNKMFAHTQTKKRSSGSTQQKNSNKRKAESIGGSNHETAGSTTAHGSKKFHSSLLNMRWLRLVVDEGLGCAREV